MAKEQGKYEMLKKLDPNQARDFKAKYGGLLFAFDVATMF